MIQRLELCVIFGSHCKRCGVMSMNLSWQRLYENVYWIIDTRYLNVFNKTIVKLLVNSMNTNVGVFCAMLDIE